MPCAPRSHLASGDRDRDGWPGPAQPVSVHRHSSPPTSRSRFSEFEFRKRTPVKLICFRFICEKPNLGGRKQKKKKKKKKKKNASWFLAGGSFATFELCCVRPCRVTVSFFPSFFLFEIERFQFPFLVSLLFLFVLVHGHFCSVVVGFSISQPPFPSSQYVIPSEKCTSMTSVDCRVISSSHVQFDEVKVRLWHSCVRIQASDGCKSWLSRWLRCWRGSKPTSPWANPEKSLRKGSLVPRAGTKVSLHKCED